MSQRLFVAIDVPEDGVARLARLRDEHLDARWTPDDQFHLTLRFIGEVEDERVDDLRAALGGISVGGFTVESRGLDVFPSRRNPRVLVAGVEPAPRLVQLQRRVDEALGRVGVAPDRKPFNPHITLARLKGARSQDVRRYLREHAGAPLPPFTVSDFHLYRSTLSPEGAVHERIASYALAGRP